MSDPTIKSISINIAYSGSDGYRSELRMSSKAAKTAGLPPHAPLFDAIDELARLSALFGFEKEAREAFEAACARVADFNAKRAISHE